MLWAPRFPAIPAIFDSLRWGTVTAIIFSAMIVIPGVNYIHYLILMISGLILYCAGLNANFHHWSLMIFAFFLLVILFGLFRFSHLVFLRLHTPKPQNTAEQGAAANP